MTTSAWVGGYSQGSTPLLPSAPALTTKYYDGEDRLVEVAAPRDVRGNYPPTTTTTSDLYTNPWITRYIYDLSQNGTIGTPTFDGQPVTAHGNVYETQELLPPLNGGTTITQTQTGATPAPMANTQFQETKGTAYDALDRATALLRYQVGGSQLEQTKITYDATNDSVGMLTSRCNALNQCSALDYDPRGQATSLVFNGSTPSRTATYDPDGRTVTITSATFGTQWYAYDANGNVTTSTEPNQGGVTSSATMTYHYYPDSTRESLDVSSTGLSQTGLFRYAYGTDGTLKQLVVEDDANTAVGTITLTYYRDNAGRVVSRTESGGGGQLQNCSGSCWQGLAPGTDNEDYTYNANGNTPGLPTTVDLFPGGTLGNRFITTEQWDSAGNMLGEAITAGGSTKYDTYEVDSNGRLAGIANGAGPSVYYANGTMIQGGDGDVSTWDARNGVAVSTSTSSSSNASTFDAAGRLTGETVSGSTMTATYDAESHLTGESWAGIGSSGYQWGPNGHPITIGSQENGGSFQYDTLHWDGDQLLFTTNSQGQVDDIKVGAFGDITPLDSGFTGLTLWDRDVSGEVVACHSATGAAGNGIDAPWKWYRFEPEPPAYTSPCSMQGADAPGWSIPWTEYPGSIVWTQESPGELFKISQVGHGGLLGMPRTDGFTDGFTTIQGVRTYDGFVGAWMEPDPSGGAMTSVESQQAYGYNNGNPVSYGDFNGMSTAAPAPPTDVGPYCAQNSDGSIWCWGPACGSASACVWGCNWDCQLNRIPFYNAFSQLPPFLIIRMIGNSRYIVQGSAGFMGSGVDLTVNGCGAVVVGSSVSASTSRGGGSKGLGGEVSVNIAQIFPNPGYNALNFLGIGKRSGPTTTMTLGADVSVLVAYNNAGSAFGAGAGDAASITTDAAGDSNVLTKGLCK